MSVKPAVTVSSSDLVVSQQKMLFNIMQTNIMLCQYFAGIPAQTLNDKLFNIDPVKDLGITFDDKKTTMNPKKC